MLTNAQVIHVKMVEHVQTWSTTIIAAVCLDTPDAIVQLVSQSPHNYLTNIKQNWSYLIRSE